MEKDQVPPLNAPTSVVGLAIKSGLYVVLLAGAAFMPTLDLRANLISWDDQYFTELSFVELGQIALLAVGCALVLWQLRGAAYRALGGLLLLFLSVALVRELDYFLDNYFFDGTWQVVVSIIALAGIAWLAPRRRQLGDELRAFSSHTSFGLMVAGFATVVAFSRLLGRNDFWKSFLAENYDRSVKNLVEESVELLGFGLLILGVLEFVMAVRKISKNRADASEPKP